MPAGHHQIPGHWLGAGFATQELGDPARLLQAEVCAEGRQVGEHQTADLKDPGSIKNAERRSQHAKRETPNGRPENAKRDTNHARRSTQKCNTQHSARSTARFSSADRKAVVFPAQNAKRLMHSGRGRSRASGAGAVGRDPQKELFQGCSHLCGGGVRGGGKASA